MSRFREVIDEILEDVENWAKEDMVEFIQEELYYRLKDSDNEVVESYYKRIKK